jgi:hypothetical protein
MIWFGKSADIGDSVKHTLIAGREMSTPTRSICSQCAKVNFEFFTTPGSYDEANEEFPDLFWDGLCLETCGFCQLLYHCIYPTGNGHLPLQGTLRGWYAVHELQFRLYDGESSRKLDYSIRHSKPTAPLQHNPPVQESKRFDFHELEGWLKECQNHPCFPADELLHSLPDHFRVIDVKSSCIFQPQERVEYCALSYVWGDNDQQFKLDSSNEKQAEVPGFLKGVPLPRTIEDAIALCEDIGCLYLWVDSLCIVQDDEKNKHTQIASMAEVYSQSLVTFIAATGSDSNAGLAPYGGRNSVIPYLIRRIPLGTFVASLSPQIAAQEIATSTWASRGWTLQEYALARRVLFFTGSYAFLRCKEALRCEDFGLGFSNCYEKDRKWDLPLPPFYRRKAAFGRHYPSTFSQMLAQYVRRTLTYKEDILDAFTGILARMEDREYGPGGIGEKHIFGLPSKQFGAALQWTTKLPWPTTERDGFPSWSWAGWIHATDPIPPRKGHFHDIYQGFDDQIADISVLTCYMVRGAKRLKTIERNSFESMLQTLNQEARILRRSTRGAAAEVTLMDLQLRLLFAPQAPDEVNEYIGNPEHSAKYFSQHVFLWASCATLDIDQERPFPVFRDLNVGFPIRLKDGSEIGSIRLKREWLEEQKGPMHFFVSTAGLYPGPSPHTLELKFKIILIQLCHDGALPVYKRIQVSQTPISQKDWARASPKSKYIAIV